MSRGTTLWNWTGLVLGLVVMAWGLWVVTRGEHYWWGILDILIGHVLTVQSLWWLHFWKTRPDPLGPPCGGGSRRNGPRG